MVDDPSPIHVSVKDGQVIVLVVTPGLDLALKLTGTNALELAQELLEKAREALKG